MADNKNYYYLKLKDNFFDSDEIKVLESMENGYKYSNILLKMYLKSIKREGLLIFNEKIPYNAQMIATVTGHNTNDVKQALVLFQELGLLEILSNGAIYMLDIQNYIGKSSTEADRKRLYRKNIEEEKAELLNGCNIGVSRLTTNVGQMSDKTPPEIEIEIEKDIELDNIYSQVIKYLNLRTGKNYKTKSAKTKSLINARIKDGFTLDDFKTVIDTKINDWQNTNYEKFIRPETLFSNKFESYLNQSIKVVKTEVDNGTNDKAERILNEITGGEEVDIDNIDF